MAEPIIGMKFGTYETKTDALYSDYLLGKGKYKGTERRRFLIELDSGYNCTYTCGWRKKDDGFDSTQIMIDTKNRKHAKVHAGENNGLDYLGETRYYEAGRDIKFTRIVGKNYYAVDINGNGRVDKGEIFKVKAGCADAAKDEKLYKLNTTI